MTRRIELVAIGGSAGAIEVLRSVLSQLPRALGPAVVVVVHLPPDGPNLLHEILATPGGPPMKVAEDKEPVAPGTIYFAAPDYHLLIENGRTFALSLDERIHFSRPAIDVLFESAAAAYGDRMMGVVLSGANADGAAGLAVVAASGGMTVVQSPEHAEMSAMPTAAFQAVPDSISVDASALATLLRAYGEVNV